MEGSTENGHQDGIIPPLPDGERFPAEDIPGSAMAVGASGDPRVPSTFPPAGEASSPPAPEWSAGAAAPEAGRGTGGRPPLTGFRLAAFLFGLILIGGLLVGLFGMARDAVRFTAYTLYFSDLQGTRLVPVARRVRRPADDQARLVAVLQELIHGPVANDTLPSVPRGTRVLGAWISGDTAFVNLDRTLVLGLPENADAEVLAVYAIVTAVVENVPGIGRVQLLVDDVPLQTLRGLSRTGGALEPRRDLVGGD